MRSKVTIVEPNTGDMFTTLDRVKRELSIRGNSHDATLRDKIREASSAVQAYLGYRVPRELVSEEFWAGFNDSSAEYLSLRRVPVVSIVSVTLGDTLLETTEYRIEDGSGLLSRISDEGYPRSWYVSKNAVVVYSGGYILPGVSGRTLEPAIESGVLALVRSFWFSRGRDPLVRSISVEGLERRDYWVGTVGDGLPPDVCAMLDPFCRGNWI